MVFEYRGSTEVVEFVVKELETKVTYSSKNSQRMTDIF